MKKQKIENSIPMIEFLMNYVCLTDIIDEGTIKMLSNATHRDIKELNIPFVQAVPFESVTKEDLKKGNIIYVYDGKSTKRNRRVAPYIRPEVLKEEQERGTHHGKVRELK